MLSISRPRRQMMTQQQRNNKRQRASPQQLAYLRKIYVENPKPDQGQREEIGRKIDMTPRSVQIWFQNNRAKTKSLEKKMVNRKLHTITTNCTDQISRVRVKYTRSGPDSTTSGSGDSLSSMSPRSASASSGSHIAYSIAGRKVSISSPSLTDSPNSSHSWVILPCTCLEIGKWHQSKPLRPNNTGFWVQYDPQTQVIEYLVLEHNVMHSIKVLVPELQPNFVHYDSNIEGLGHLTLSPVGAPVFSIGSYKVDGSMDWQACGDFTNGAIYIERRHYLSGGLVELQEQLRVIDTERRRILQTSPERPIHFNTPQTSSTMMKHYSTTSNHQRTVDSGGDAAGGLIIYGLDDLEGSLDADISSIMGDNSLSQESATTHYNYTDSGVDSEFGSPAYASRQRSRSNTGRLENYHTLATIPMPESQALRVKISQYSLVSTGNTPPESPGESVVESLVDSLADSSVESSLESPVAMGAHRSVFDLYDEASWSSSSLALRSARHPYPTRMRSTAIKQDARNEPDFDNRLFDLMSDLDTHTNIPTSGISLDHWLEL